MTTVLGDVIKATRRQGRRSRRDPRALGSRVRLQAGREDLLSRILKVGEVWFAWTEDPTDELLKRYARTTQRPWRRMTASAQAMAMAGRDDRAQGILNVLGMFGAAGGENQGCLGHCQVQSTARGQSRATVELPTLLCTPWQMRTPAFTRLDRRTTRIAHSQGTSVEEKALRPTSSRLRLTVGGVIPSGSVASCFGESQDRPPFSAPRLRSRWRGRARCPFFQEHYWGALDQSNEWRRIDLEWLGQADDLALAIAERHE